MFGAGPLEDTRRREREKRERDALALVALLNSVEINQEIDVAFVSLKVRFSAGKSGEKEAFM